MQFKVISSDKDTAARTGEITTTRGRIRTPVFMPVATRGAIRALSGRDVEELDFDIILSNPPSPIPIISTCVPAWRCCARREASMAS